MGLGDFTLAHVCVHTNAHNMHICVCIKHTQLESRVDTCCFCLSSYHLLFSDNKTVLGTVPVPTEAVNHWTHDPNEHMVPASTGQCEGSRSGLVTDSFSQRSSGTALYSLSVTEGLFASQRLCHLLDRMMKIYYLFSWVVVGMS